MCRQRIDFIVIKLEHLGVFGGDLVGLEEVLLVVGHEVWHYHLAVIALIEQRLVKPDFNILGRQLHQFILVLGLDLLEHVWTAGGLFVIGYLFNIDEARCMDLFSVWVILFLF